MDIETLKQEAARAGDEAMVALCDRALRGDVASERELRRAFADARANDETLPARATEAVLAWIAGDGPDPWETPC